MPGLTMRAFCARAGAQVGGGLRADNAGEYLDAGASHVIITSYVFRDGALDAARLAEVVRAVGRRRLVLDLSCRRNPAGQARANCICGGEWGGGEAGCILDLAPREIW